MDTSSHIKSRSEEYIGNIHLQEKPEATQENVDAESYLQNDFHVGSTLPVKFEQTSSSSRAMLTADNLVEKHRKEHENVFVKINSKSVNTKYSVHVKLESEEDNDNMVETTETELQRPDIYYNQVCLNVARDKPQNMKLACEKDVEDIPSITSHAVQYAANNTTDSENRKSHSKTCDKLSKPKSLLYPHEYAQGAKILKISRKFKVSCSVCGIHLSKNAHLKVHMRTHTNEKPFGCSICNNKFSQRGSLTRHMKIHKGEKPFKCSICDKHFAENGKLTIHLRKHSGEKPYACQICGKKTSDKLVLRRHMRTHTGEKPYTCSVCPKKFADNGGLTNHMRVHTGERLFECLICGKRLSKKVHLKSHMFIHTGETPFGCSTCGKKYTKKQDLKKHMAKHLEENS